MGDKMGLIKIAKTKYIDLNQSSNIQVNFATERAARVVKLFAHLLKRSCQPEDSFNQASNLGDKQEKTISSY